MKRDSAISNELQRLADIHGGTLQPRTVVHAARDEASPLHSSFEWNDSDAAEQWRLQQARMLIRAVVVYEETGKGKQIPCRVFVSLTPDRKNGGEGYRLSATVLSDAAQRSQLLTDARADMHRFKERYRTLSELAEVFTAMEHVEQDELAHTA